MGCGNLIDLTALGLPHEATAQQTLRNGADLVLFSGDKLLGGPQAGVIAGRKDLIAQIKQNPLKRALRLDKMTLAALEATLKLYRHPTDLLQALPTLRLLTRCVEDIQAQTTRLAPIISDALGERYRVASVAVASQIGSGSLPQEILPSAALAIRATDQRDETLRTLSEDLRACRKPIVGRLKNGALLLDLRCLATSDEDDFIAQFSGLR
ncbi:MAG: L-seryl-tRNA(Sec) selenium transferase [Halieaceae bacterium]|nr:MAG: L-seryl-tRNA(Sec) selenium transferase [Halieaceae bacterium]